MPEGPNQTSAAELPRESLLSHGATAFAFVLGVAYSTGFLIVSTYLGSFGIPEVTNDFLRIK
jgi:hypothetical protein